jgi:alkyl hydroperoxide reductase subunit AhpC
MARLAPEFAKRNTKIIGLSVDPVDSHKGWSKDIEDVMGAAPNYPMIGDPDLKISKLYGMLPAGAGETSQGRTAADNATVRNVFVIGPDKVVKLIIVYPMSTGRNFDEVLRVIDSLQLTAEKKLATPVNWQPGERAIIVPAVSDEDAKKLFPQGWEAKKPYLRYVDVS